MISAVVLAAGESSRFGGQKLLAPLHGAPIIRWTVENVVASVVEDVVVVLGREAHTVREALAGLPVRCVVNERYREGLSTSLRAGIEALAPGAAAALVALGDQPGVSAAVIDRLVDEFRRSGSPIVAPVYNDVRGNPVLFAASLFAELQAVRGDQGAREIIARHATRVAAVPFPQAMPADVDTPADHRALLAGPRAERGRAAP
jgi:molybdenum cofactor cytidylyltransferase